MLQRVHSGIHVFATLGITLSLFWGSAAAGTTEALANNQVTAPVTENSSLQDDKQPSASPLPLTPLTASYTAKFDKGVAIEGSATRTLKQNDDGTWLYEFKVDSFLADIRESLTLRWQNGQVIPLAYHYQLGGFLIKTRERVINFDWNSGVATGHFRGKAFSLKLKPGALDPLGFQLQLHQDIRAGKTEMRYSVIDKGRYDEDRFAVIGEEELQIAGKSVHTVKAEKVRNEGSKRETLMWFAPDQAYLMMRLVQLEPDGTRYQINISESEIRR